MDDGSQRRPDSLNATTREGGTTSHRTSGTVRIVLIALGVVLLVASLPLLFMSGMMGMMMGSTGGGTWFMGVLSLLVLAAGVAALVAGIRHR